MKVTLKKVCISALLILVGGVVIFEVAQWYYSLPPLASFLLPGACVNLDEATYRNIGNAEFHAVDTNCDTFGSEEFVNVYAYKNDASTVLPRWLRRRTVVFVYDPGAPNNLPRFEAIGNNRIRIFIPEVSSILQQQASWDGNLLEYNIGKVYYPSANVAAGK